jgi:predicted GNAT family acetyltransferase
MTRAARQVERIHDASRFLAEASSLLLADEARHNLMLGLADTIRSNPNVYPDHSFWLVRDGGDVVGAAMRTPPHHLVIARPRDDAALAALADHIDEKLPGAQGAVPEVDVFVAAWCERRQLAACVVFEQAIYALREVADVPRAEGACRHATADDYSLIVSWSTAFSREALNEASPTSDIERQVQRRLDSPAAGFRLWERGGKPVSLCGFSGRTPHGIRIGPVYTPPEHRGRGYGTSLVADVSAELLAAGYGLCFLFTDLTNPTSNAIYQRIGYERVCESRQLRFE